MNFKKSKNCVRQFVSFGQTNSDNYNRCANCQVPYFINLCSVLCILRYYLSSVRRSILYWFYVWLDYSNLMPTAQPHPNNIIFLSRLMTKTLLFVVYFWVLCWVWHWHKCSIFLHHYIDLVLSFLEGSHWLRSFSCRLGNCFTMIHL